MSRVQPQSAPAAELTGPASFDALFSSPLLQFRVPGASPLNAALTAEIEHLRASHPGINRSNRNGWHSADDFFHRAEPAMTGLKAQIIEAVRLGTLAVSPRFDFTRFALQMEGWINVSGRGAYNAPHNHPAFAWSGVYYVAVPPDAKGDSGAIEFIDPRTNARVPTIEGAACFLDGHKLKPVPGLLLLFPSYLRHWVYPNDDDALRISIAFNARFIPR